MSDKITIGEWYKVRDFEDEDRPVFILGAVEDRPDFYWARFTDGAVYDFHLSDLIPL